jgi:hypothetical protein
LFVELAPVSLSVLLIVGQLQNLVAVDVHLCQRRSQLGVDELFLFGAFGFGLLALFFELILQLAVPVDALIHGLELLLDCLLLLLHALQDVLQLLLQLQIGGSQLGCQLLYRRLVAARSRNGPAPRATLHAFQRLLQEQKGLAGVDRLDRVHISDQVHLCGPR